MPEPAKDPAQPEILPPETTSSPGARITLRKRAEHWFSDENIGLFAHILDDWFRIPFTPIRIGLIPGLGDILAGIASFVIVIAAWIRGVPWITLVRMMVNLGIEVVIGSIPLFGDVFDIAWKANRRNYHLMMRHIQQPHRHTWKDYAFLLTLLGGVVAILAVPFIVLLIIVLWLLHRL